MTFGNRIVLLVFSFALSFGFFQDAIGQSLNQKAKEIEPQEKAVTKPTVFEVIVKDTVKISEQDSVPNHKNIQKAANEEETEPDTPADKNNQVVDQLKNSSDKAESKIFGNRVTRSSPKTNPGQQPSNTFDQKDSLTVDLEPCEVLSPKRHKSALKKIGQQSFEDAKLALARKMITTDCVTTAQVKEIISAFQFEKTKLDFAKEAWHRTTDKNNFSVLNESFDSPTTIQELNAYIEQQQ